jgi:hypothetical protein
VGINKGGSWLGCPGYKGRSYSETNETKRAWGMIKVVELLPSKFDVLSLKNKQTKKWKKGKQNLVKSHCDIK